MHEYKKYPNRRLYDLSDSRYVKVDALREVIIGGESIRVLDSRDDSDITRSVLLQILAEQESEEHEAILTNRVIEQLIRLYGDAFGAVASRYIEQSILAFLEYQEQYQSQLKKRQDPFAVFRDQLASAWPPRDSNDGPG